MNRRLTLAFTLTWLLFSVTAYSQMFEENETETVQSTAARPAPRDQALDLAAVAQRLISRTNAWRREEDRQPVEVNPRLMHTARDFAHFMARTDTYGHTADGKRPATRAQQHGYHACIIAENIANYYSPSGITTEALAQWFFQGWKQSPGHRQNMLDPDVTETGVAVAQSKQTGYWYAVQMFGRPLSQRLTFQVANRANVGIDYVLGGRTLPLPPRSTRTHQRCRPAELVFQWPDEQERTTVHPQNGERYTVVREDSGKFRVK